MIEVRVDLKAAPLVGENTYTGWFLRYTTHPHVLQETLELDGEGASHSEPRLMLIRVGDKGAFKVSPVTGRLLGFEVFGVRITGGDILRERPPDARRAGALTIPLEHPYDATVFELGVGEAPCLEAGFRQVGYRVAAKQSGDRFRVQFFRGGPAESYLRVADCLIAGLDDANALVELWLENVQKTGQHG